MLGDTLNVCMLIRGPRNMILVHCGCSCRLVPIYRPGTPAAKYPPSLLEPEISTLTYLANESSAV